MALKEIRDDRLYQEDGLTDFEKYTREKWGWNRRYADDVIGSAQLRLSLPDISRVSARGAHSEEGGFKTFEDYCKGKWELSKPRAYQLMDAAEIRLKLPDLAGTEEETSTDCRPAWNEHQMRQLGRLKSPID